MCSVNSSTRDDGLLLLISDITAAQSVWYVTRLSSDEMRPSRLKRRLKTTHPALANNPKAFFVAQSQSLKKAKLDCSGAFQQLSLNFIEVVMLIARSKKNHSIGETLIKSSITRGGNSSVVKCSPLNWKVGWLVHSHRVKCRRAPCARALTSTAPVSSGVTIGARADICSRTQHCGGAKVRSECYALITKCQMSADAGDCRSRVSFRRPNSFFSSMQPWTGWVGSPKLSLPPGAGNPGYATSGKNITQASASRQKKARLFEYVVCIISKYWFHLKFCDLPYFEILFRLEGNMPSFCTRFQHVGLQEKNL